MVAESIFSIAHTVALVAWILLAVAPKWRVTHILVLTGVQVSMV